VTRPHACAGHDAFRGPRGPFSPLRKSATSPADAPFADVTQALHDEDGSSLGENLAPERT
jgi:hypothetical protein